MLDFFEYPLVLLLLLLLPVYAWLYYGRRRRRSGPMMFSRVGMLRKLTAGPRAILTYATPALRLFAIFLMIVAAARPSTPEHEEAQVEGVDIYVVLDMSGSMQAIDITDKQLKAYQRKSKEPPNRFVIAKEVLSDFVLSRTNDRIGMVVFARDAFLQFPLTLDYGTILTQLQNLELGDIDGSGTAIGNALGRAVAGLRDPRSAAEDQQDDSERTRLVVLITDGDRRGGNISPMEAARFAVDENIKIFPILVGKEGKARVPVGRDLFTNRVTYRYEQYPVDAKLLEGIAKTTGGEFYRATDKKALEKNLHAILDSFERAPIEDVADVRRKPYFEPFLALGLAFLLMEMLLTYIIIRPFP